ncbi:MAG TPA: amidohydrolase family protein [Terracidiphilus sp.]|nr:amidohydrolase family protein [Terracidiphilus sp.]
MLIARRISFAVVIQFVLATSGLAQRQANPLAQFVKVDAPAIVLEHVRVIDGTGAAQQDDMRVVISGGKITAVEAMSAQGSVPAGAKVLDLTGKTVIPGLVGMHEHLFYPLPDRPAGGLALYGEMADSAPRLYLAGGVTTARTGGSLEPYTDLEVKRAIDAGQIPGPRLDVTGPYLEGKGTFAIQMHQLSDADDAARTVDYWASEGVTSFKAYNYLTAAELKAAVDHAHAHGLKLTGHLCSIGFTQAAELGIDNLEHGIAVDTEFFPGKKPDECPSARAVEAYMDKNIDVNGPQVSAMIKSLVAHHVAVTSTLAIFETFAPGRPPMLEENAALKTLTTEAAKEYLATRARVAESSTRDKMLEMEMKFERAFAAAGGLLMAGCDPTGYGGVVPGFGDQRNVELLVQAGFTPLEAIRVATLNGATYMGKANEIGSIAPGKAADLVVLDGNPAEKIENIEKVDTVFKDGIGYDPAKLIQSVTGLVGLR